MWSAQDFTEVGYDDFYLGCLLTNMNDPETRQNIKQFQNPILCFHDPSLPIQIRETLNIFYHYSDCYYSRNNTYIPTFTFSDNRNNTFAFTFTFSGTTRTLGGRQKSFVRTTGDTLSRWDKISHENSSKISAFLEGGVGEWASAALLALPHSLELGWREVPFGLDVKISEEMPRVNTFRPISPILITWCQVLLDRFDWFWHVWNMDLEPHWSQGWFRHVKN